MMFITSICACADERLITPVWELSRGLRLATRDGLQGKSERLRPFLRRGRGEFFSCPMRGGQEPDAAVAP